MESHQGTGVGGVWRIVLQKSRQAKVGHFAHQVAVDQDVPGCQISVDVVHVTQVFHSGSYPSQHPHQLDHCELAIVLLQQENKRTVITADSGPERMIKPNLFHLLLLADLSKTVSCFTVLCLSFHSFD